MLNNFRKVINFKAMSLIYLIIVGEMVFALPFHISRFFRPALLEDFNYTNTMLGVAFSVYGITALLSYLPGGYIADKISPKYLLFFSLLMTSFGGLFFLYNPGYLGLCMIYAFWGITTILFFWAALIKATRNIAGKRQGLFFGALESGRGLIASICGSVAVIIYSSSLLPKVYNYLFDTTISSLSAVILFYTLVTFASSIMILVFFKDDNTKALNIKKPKFKSIINNKKSIISISIVVLAAYSGYKGIDYYSYYFYEILSYSKEKSSLIITNLSYLRPISAIMAGIIADRITSKLSCFFLFLLMIVSYTLLSIIKIDNSLIFLLYGNFIISMIAVFSLRGIFYSLLEEIKLPAYITGVSVGIISFIGYMPDIFIGPTFGYFLDKSTDIGSFQNCFILLLLLSILGFIASLKLDRKKIL